MTGTIRHIGKNDPKAQKARYKRLVNSGIFRDKDTRNKLIDCQGDFETWTNQPAISWIKARVKELREDRELDISCNCCESTDSESSAKQINPHCHALEIICIIKHLEALETK